MTTLCELADKYQTDKGGRSTMYGGVHGELNVLHVGALKICSG